MSSHEHHHGHSDALPAMLDLDAEVMASTLDGVRAEIGQRADGPVRTILDLGAGTGTGTFGLLKHFPEASVTAVDGSDDMLQRIQSRAHDLGLTARVTTLQADLDEGVPSDSPVDLAWAAASLHHLSDPDRTLPQVAAAIRPGGLLAVIEMGGLPRFLDDDTPGGTAEAKAHALLAADRAVDMPTMGGDWAPRLTRAGLVVEVDRKLVVDLTPPSTSLTSDYAFATLSRIRGAVVDRLEDGDREQLDHLLDGGDSDVRHRHDLHVRSERHLLIARTAV